MKRVIMVVSHIRHENIQDDSKRVKYALESIKHDSNIKLLKLKEKTNKRIKCALEINEMEYIFYKARLGG